MLSRPGNTRGNQVLLVLVQNPEPEPYQEYRQGKNHACAGKGRLGDDKAPCTDETLNLNKIMTRRLMYLYANYP